MTNLAYDDVTSDLMKLEYERVEVKNRVAIIGMIGTLHLGEIEVMVYALEEKINSVILDDYRARTKANQLGLDVVGTLGILVLAKEDGLINDLG